jgi:alpha-tubulin suppressor-like RCC1 family protein
VKLPDGLYGKHPYQFAIGPSHVLIRSSNGLVFGSGCNKEATLGLNDSEIVTSFTEIPFKEEIIIVACGGTHSLALGKSGIHILKY